MNMRNVFKSIFTLILSISLVCTSVMPMLAAENEQKSDPDTDKQTLSIITYNIKDGRHKIDDKTEKRTIEENLENIAKEIIKYSKARRSK